MTASASRRWPEPGTGSVGGSVLLVGGVGLVIVGLLQDGVHGAWRSTPGIGVFAAATVLLVAFSVDEARVGEPMLPPWVFVRRVLLGAALGWGAVGVLSRGLTTFVPTFAQGVLGAGPVVAGFVLAGLVLAGMTVGWPLASSQSGRLSAVRLPRNGVARCGDLAPARRRHGCEHVHADARAGARGGGVRCGRELDIAALAGRRTPAVAAVLPDSLTRRAHESQAELETR